MPVNLSIEYAPYAKGLTLGCKLIKRVGKNRASVYAAWSTLAPEPGDFTKFQTSEHLEAQGSLLDFPDGADGAVRSA